MFFVVFVCVIVPVCVCLSAVKMRHCVCVCGAKKSRQPGRRAELESVCVFVVVFACVYVCVCLSKKWVGCWITSRSGWLLELLTELIILRKLTTHTSQWPTVAARLSVVPLMTRKEGTSPLIL